MAAWYQEYFDRGYLKRWQLGLPGPQVRQNAALIVRHLQARAPGTLLDVGCGQGRYSLALATHGLTVVGVDRSPVLLDEARRLAAHAGVEATWVRADIRSLPFRSAFYSATLLDAFGFFETDDENEGVVVEVVKALRARGGLALAVVNGDQIRATFRPTDREESDDVIIELERELLDDGRFLREHMTLVEAEATSKFERVQRLYSGSDLERIAVAAGLGIVAICGDFQGATFHPTRSERIMMIGRKK